MSGRYFNAPVSPATIQAYATWVNASRATSAIKQVDQPGFHSARIALRAASAALKVACDVDRANFAASRGWKFGNRFNVRQLKAGNRGRLRGEQLYIEYPWLDHEEFLYSEQRPAAILSHSYVDWSSLLEFAACNGLDVEPLSASWYFPSGAQAALFTVARP